MIVTFLEVAYQMSLKEYLMTFDMDVEISGQDSGGFFHYYQKKPSIIKNKSINFIFDNTWSHKIS